jgi:N-acetylmuramic acid 6-phosphate etherase
MLTTGAFIRTGYVWGNLMVNVQPNNSKLHDRAIRIIATATGVSWDEAGEMLRASDNNVRAAITAWENKKANGE